MLLVSGGNLVPATYLSGSALRTYFLDKLCIEKITDCLYFDIFLSS